MANIGRLNALKVSKLTKPGLYADGGGLYLAIRGDHGRSWVFRYRGGPIGADGRRKLRDMGIGSADTLSLADARAKATELRKARLDGKDPLVEREAARAAAAFEAAKAMTFRECAQAYIDAHKVGWKNEKHAAQWPSTLKAYAYPVFGSLSVAAIDTGLVMKAVEAIWLTKTETASRLRGRIESVMDWATVRGFRQGENPARWKGHLDHLLPERAKVQKVEHHAALPYAEMGAFMEALCQQQGVSALALEFAILTAARTGEVIGATWDEIDLPGKMWTVPAERMKASKEHRVPLSAPALAVMTRLFDARTGDFVFPGGKAGKPLSSMALLMTLRRMNRGDLTAHGFRSSFRDWAAERTNFPRDVAEQALAHSLPDKVEAAYRRGDLFEKRRQIMDAWAKHCGTMKPAAGAVVAIRG